MVIDFRSDTLTAPSEGMIAAMASAETGDDVYGEDPNANSLEKRIAELSGKEAAIFMPSGTQSNLIAILAHCPRGAEFIVGNNYHTFKYEAGGAAVLGGLSPNPLAVDKFGVMAQDNILAAIKPDDFHFAQARLLCLENTTNGMLVDQDYIKDTIAKVRSRGLSAHLDGARVFNASVKSGLSLKELADPFDSVSICFSKGMGTPVGSVLVGSSKLILDARRLRKMLGGGMRQIGVLTAACHYALDHNIDRMADDHANAKILAEGLNGLDSISVDMDKVQTNMVFATFEADYLSKLRKQLSDSNIKIASDDATLRFVTHLNISQNDTERFLTICRSI